MPPLHQSVCLARGLYRRILCLLPRRFYAEYAEQMALDFDDLLQDTTTERASVCRVAATTVRAVGDVLLAAVRERFALLHELDAAPITPRVKTAIRFASSEELRSCGVSADGRLLLGLATEQHGLAGVVLRELGVHPDRLRASFRELECSTEHNTPTSESDNAGASIAFARQLTNAAECARTFGHNFTGTEHLAMSLLAETNSDAARLIERLGVDPNSVRDVLAERTRSLELARPRRRWPFSKS